jgi:hypothetical protein
MEEFRIKIKDSLGNERTQHDEVRGVGKAFEDWASLAGAAAYPATLLNFVLPDTTTFTVATAVLRDKTKQFARLKQVLIKNKEADNRDFVFYDGDPAGAAGTFQQLIPTITVLAGSDRIIDLEGFMCTFDLYVDPSGTKTNGVEVAVSALVINKEIIE